MIDKVPDSPNTSVVVGPLRLKRNNSEPFDGLRCSTVLEASTTPQRRSWVVLHGSMRRVSYVESIHLGSLNSKEIPICLCVVTVVTQWSGIQKDQKGSSLFITLSLSSFIWMSVPHEPQHRAWAMSQSFDQIYFEARSEIWRFCSLIIPSNGSIRRC